VYLCVRAVHVFAVMNYLVAEDGNVYYLQNKVTGSQRQHCSHRQQQPRSIVVMIIDLSVLSNNFDKTQKWRNIEGKINQLLLLSLIIIKV